jgi:hypothetical protein
MDVRAIVVVCVEEEECQCILSDPGPMTSFIRVESDVVTDR